MNDVTIQISSPPKISINIDTGNIVNVGTLPPNVVEVEEVKGDIIEVTDCRRSSSIFDPNIFILGEPPQGLINGINTTFTTLNNFYQTKIAIYLNGLRVPFFSCPTQSSFILEDAPLAGDELLVDYIKTS